MYYQLVKLLLLQRLSNTDVVTLILQWWHDPKWPQLNIRKLDERVQHLRRGRYHCLFRRRDQPNALYMQGKNHFGQLGLSARARPHVQTPVRLTTSMLRCSGNKKRPYTDVDGDDDELNNDDDEAILHYGCGLHYSVVCTTCNIFFTGMHDFNPCTERACRRMSFLDQWQRVWFPQHVAQLDVGPIAFTLKYGPTDDGLFSECIVVSTRLSFFSRPVLTVFHADVYTGVGVLAIKTKKNELVLRRDGIKRHWTFGGGPILGVRLQRQYAVVQLPSRLDIFAVSPTSLHFGVKIQTFILFNVKDIVVFHPKRVF